MRRTLNTGKLKLLLSLALCAVLLLAAAAASAVGLEETLTREIDPEYRSLVPFLRPVGAVCEQSGIRLEIISGAVQGNRSLFLYTVEDLDSDRIGADTVVYLDVEDLGTMVESRSPGGYVSVGWPKRLCIQETLYENPVENPDRLVTLALDGLWLHRRTTVDLMPFVKIYAVQAEGVEAPKPLSREYNQVAGDLFPTLLGLSEEDQEALRRENEIRNEFVSTLRVLDVKQPLDIPLSENVYLAGIGWIDGLLHVQVRYVNPETVKVDGNPSSFYKPFSLYINESSEGVYDRGERQDVLPYMISPLEWDETGDGVADRAEYLFCFTPEEADKITLTAVTDKNDGLLRDNWEVSFPLQSVWAELSADVTLVTVTQIEPEDIVIEDEAAARMKDFFCYWYANDLENMLSLCAPSWQQQKENPKTALFALLANQTPLNLVVDSVSDVVENSETFTVTVLVDRNNGKDPVRRRFRIAMLREEDSLWYLNPESLQNSETVPDDILPVEPTEAPTETPVAVGPDTVLYYNQAGGEYYHLDPNCRVINPRFLPLQDSFTYSEVNDEKYSYLKPCQICGAPMPPQEQ